MNMQMRNAHASSIGVPNGRFVRRPPLKHGDFTRLPSVKTDCVRRRASWLVSLASGFIAFEGRSLESDRVKDADLDLGSVAGS